MIKVKICGVTNAQDALWAANLGADYVGLNFYPPSPRKISNRHAKELAAQIPPFVTLVGIFVDEPIESIAKLVKSVPLRTVQLHGHETPEACAAARALGVKVIKAIGVRQPLQPSDVEPYQDNVDFFLFDNPGDSLPGGTGETFNWEWLQAIPFVQKPWFLAGGLNPDNIADAIKQAHPPAVDVCSGVERLPTRKDYDAMKRFIQRVKSVR